MTTEIPIRREGPLLGLIRTARPTQWTKNLLVFAAPAAGGFLLTPGYFLSALWAFLVFCGASAGTYLINDARDVEADRLHPTKRNRPIAAGVVPVGLALCVGVALLVASVAAGFLVAPALGVAVAAYLLLTTSYSLALKNIPVVDLVAVAAGFVIRAVAGAAATGVPLSEWFFIVTSAGALLVITAKREAELAHHHRSDADPTERPTRAVLSSYTPTFLASVRSIAAGLALIAYCLWAFGGAMSLGGMESNTASEQAVIPLVWAQISVVPFAIAILRYALIADAGEGERPERVILRDPTMLGAGVLWGLVYLVGSYLG